MTNGRGRPFGDSRNGFRAPFVRAFTLIEIMVVVAIMALILAAGIPSLYGFFHKSGLRKTMSDILETCQSARAKAILSGTTATLVINGREGTVEVEGGAPGGGYGSWAHSAKIEGAKLEALKVSNSHNDLSQVDNVHVHFYPDGTCDEMIMVLTTDQNQLRGISLECTTGIASALTQAQVEGLVH
ncbi:MAG TPA: type II secretion system protein [Candidatus Angelobacter sp.]|nr:type II secretion system protein [Candidatus Angelobacter sp.]